MIKKQILTLAALIGLSFLSIAHAEEAVDDRWYVAPFGTYLNAGGDRHSNDGWGGGMGFGKMIDEHFNVLLKGFYQYAGGDNGNTKWDFAGGTADVQYFPYRDIVSPYVVLGLGGMNSSHSSNTPGYGGDGGTLIGEAGAGLTYELHDNFLLRGDVRYRYNNNLNAGLQPGTEEFHDMTVNLGFVIPFGPKPTVVAEAPAPLPPPTPVAVADCSTMDDDADGVNNCDDWCPNSLPGVQVSIRGCWIVDVKFDNDKDIVKPEYFGNLDNVAKTIKEHPELVIEIQGHTSKTGGFKHNMNLSERRAMAVKNYLVNGSDLPNLTTRGYGWTQPIDTNDTEEGRANNRRVQLQVDGQPQQPR